MRAYEKVTDLSYGENPHQRAAYYAQVGSPTHLLSNVRQLGGKPLSFNNLLDLNAARMLVREFGGPACVIVKHNNPCGVAMGEDALDAYRKALACDPQSAFGGVVVCNRPLDGAFAEALVQQFAEVLFAPGYDEAALAVLASRPNLRVLQDEEAGALHLAEPDLKQVAGGLLVQDRDLDTQERAEMTVATRREPTDAEWSELLFAWRVCKHVRSNAIVLSRGGASVGVGAGQMSRVDSVRIALEEGARRQRAGRRDGLRRLLPLPRRAAGGDRRRRHGDRPARRLGARRADDRRVRRGRCGDGLHQPAPLQALSPIAGRGGLRVRARGRPRLQARRRAADRDGVTLGARSVVRAPEAA